MTLNNALVMLIAKYEAGRVDEGCRAVARFRTHREPVDLISNGHHVRGSILTATK